jgi:hypothetical protein
MIGFELGRRTLPLTSPEALRAWFEKNPGSAVLFRAPQARKLPPELLPGLRFVYDETGRKASPYAIAALRPSPPATRSSCGRSPRWPPSQSGNMGPIIVGHGF